MGYKVKVEELVSKLRSSPRLRQKLSINNLWNILPQTTKIRDEDVLLGDDAAAIADGEEYLLLAAEGVWTPLLFTNPYMAGRASVLANVNDIYAMGGRPLAIVNVLYSLDSEDMKEVFRGMVENSSRYRVPIVGGHLTTEAEAPCLCVFILGRASKLLSGFAARAGDELVFVGNFKGKFYSNFNFWDSSSSLTGDEVVTQLELLPQLAEEGLADAARDISMSGLIGSSLMLLEASGKGADIFLQRIPVPLEVSLSQWLLTFPSFGFILSLRPYNTPEVRERFSKFGLVCETIGKVADTKRVFLVGEGGDKNLIWDFNEEVFTGVGSSLCKKKG